MWIDCITEDGDSFEAVAISSLQHMCCFMQTALLHPEWAAGFLAAARGGTPMSEQSHEEARTLMFLFPVALPRDAA